MIIGNTARVLFSRVGAQVGNFASGGPPPMATTDGARYAVALDSVAAGGIYQID